MEDGGGTGSHTQRRGNMDWVLSQIGALASAHAVILISTAGFDRTLKHAQNNLQNPALRLTPIS